MSKLLILDKDGTLTIPVSGQRFVQFPGDQAVIPGVAEKLEGYRSRGWAIALATNQGGVAAGHKTIESAKAEVDFCLGLLPQISVAALSPDFEGNECWVKRNGIWQQILRQSGTDSFRKPGAGMLQVIQGVDEYSERLFIGDRDEDEQAAATAGFSFYWVDYWLEQGDL